MKVARLQVAELAAPVTALLRDGAYYDVAILEQRWGLRAPEQPAGSFHTRVVAARCSGLDQLDLRLASGLRPTEARVQAEELLPLPPCCDERGAYLQLSPLNPGLPLRVERRDRRALLGDGQPVVLPASVARPRLEVGLAVLLGDDLANAGKRQARRAIIGIAPLLDWSAATGGDAGWQRPRWPPYAAAQLGPALVTGAGVRAALDQPLRIRLRSAPAPLRIDARQPLAARLAALSRVLPLYAGDVVGTGCLPQGQLVCDFGEQVAVQFAGMPPLRGFAVPAR